MHLYSFITGKHTRLQYTQSTCTIFTLKMTTQHPARFKNEIRALLRGREMFCSDVVRLACMRLTLTTLKYFCINHGDKGFFQCVIIINVLFMIHLNTYVMCLLPLEIF